MYTVLPEISYREYLEKNLDNFSAGKLNNYFDNADRVPHRPHRRK